MKFSFRPIPALIGWSVAALGGWLLSYLSGLSFWISFLIVAFSMFINSLIAETEDNAPGGFNNPLPPAEPKPLPKSPDDSDRVA